MLETPSLVLNRFYQAVHVTSVRKAFVLLYKGQVKALRPDYSIHDWESWRDIPPQPDDEYVVTPSYPVLVPRVVILVDYDGMPRHEVKFTRKNIFYRDRNRCQYCGRRCPSRELNLDHVVPLARGGKTTWENVVCACIACNTKKGCMTPDEAGMTLVREPRRPRWHPLYRLSLMSDGHQTWKNFLDAAYWNTELRGE